MNATKMGAFATSPGTRTADTFRKQLRATIEHARPTEVPDLLEVLRDAVVDTSQKAEIGRRIKRLRERSPYTQQALAERLHVTLRGYQKWEEAGSISFQNLQQLAEIHGVDVMFFYASEDAEQESQLDRIEAKLDTLLEWTRSQSLEALEGEQREAAQRKPVRGASTAPKRRAQGGRAKQA